MFWEEAHTEGNFGQEMYCLLPASRAEKIMWALPPISYKINDDSGQTSQYSVNTSTKATNTFYCELQNEKIPNYRRANLKFTLTLFSHLQRLALCKM